MMGFCNKWGYPLLIHHSVCHKKSIEWMKIKMNDGSFNYYNDGEKDDDVSASLNIKHRHWYLH